MADLRKILAGIAAVTAAASLSVSCSKGSNDSGNPVPTYPVAVTEPEDPHKMEITYLADYNLNPAEGESRSPALALYEDVYGGRINYVFAPLKDRTSTLDAMLASGEEVDMLPYDVSDIPDGVLGKRFQPLDPYYKKLDMESSMWNDMKPYIELLAYKNEHYVIPYSLTSPLLLTYSRKLVKDEEYDDPYELYKKGKWNWSAFTDIIEKFVKKAPRGKTRYGIQGIFDDAALHSTGKTLVNNESGKYVSNISDPDLEKAGELLRQLRTKNYYVRKKDLVSFFPTDHQTLFFASTDWTLGISNGKNPDMDLMVVPFPKPDNSDSYYFSGGCNAMLLASNSGKGDAVATYIMCERLTASTEKYIKAEKEAALKPVTDYKGDKVSFITEEQYNAICEYKNLSKFKPLFDPAWGMGGKMYGYGEYSFETRGVLDNLYTVMLDETNKAASWSELCEKLKVTVENEVQRFNS